MKHKDLAKKAGFHIASSNHDDIGWVWCSDGYPIDEELERFAELVRQDERQGCAEDYLKIMRDAVAKERQACFEFVYNYSDTYHHLGLCKRVAELMKDRGEE